MATLNIVPRKDTKPCSEALQNALDKVGYGLKYDTLSFNQGVYPVDLPLDLNSGTTITCTGEAVIKLIDKAPVNVWKSMIPIFGQSQKTVENITFKDITFWGNDTKQLVGRGKGFHNFIFLQNAKNIIVSGIKVHDSNGDGLRVKNGNNIQFHGNTVTRCGHDGLYVDGGTNVKALNNVVQLRTNSALRLRTVTNGLLQGNTVTNQLGSISSGPGIQIENPAKKTSSNILIQNNVLKNVNGPGIWAIGVGNTNKNAATGLTIQNNIFESCGLEPAAVKVPGVGGIVADGIDKLSVVNNRFKNCRGYAVLFGKFKAVSSGRGYNAVVKNNTIQGTKKAYYSGTASGTAICNLLGSKYSVSCARNIMSGNVRDYYGV